ncbi:MAG: tape measure protein [Burkholderiaceae bacterium]
MANNVEIKISADSAQAQAGISAVGKELQATGNQAQTLAGKAAPAGQSLQAVGQGADTAAAGLGKARRGVQSISEQLSLARTQIQQFIAAQLGLGAAKEVVQTADAYNNLQARIKLATGEGAAFTQGFAAVVDIAQRTNSNLTQTGDLFTRVAEAGKSAGLSTEASIAQSLRLTETVNQAVQLSGGSAQSASAAITQLIQGLQSGVLRGEEFNSVMEQAPRLAKALADGLGVTTGELRKMAEAGALSADVVINALKGQSETLKNEFATLPPTVGRALENLSTSWTLYIGQADAATGASAGAASAINALSRNLQTVGGLLLDAGQAAAGFFALRLAQRFTEIGAASAAATVATAANTTAVRANTLAAAQSDAAFKVLSADVARQTALLTGNTAAVATNTAATTANAAAAGTAAASAGRFAAILSTLKTFSLIALVTNFHDIGTAIGEAAARLAGYKDRTDELAAAERTRLAIAAENNRLVERQAVLNQAALDKQFDLSKAAALTVAEFSKLVREGKTAGEAIASIGKDFDLAIVPGIRNASAVLDKLLADGKITAAQFQQAWADALKSADLAVFEVQARAALAGTAREAERLAQVLDATLREAIRRTGLDFDVISGGMSKASRSALNDTDAIIAGLDRLKKQGVDTGLVLSTSLSKGINAADSQKALDAVRAQIESVRKALGDKLADGLLDQARQKALQLGDALDKAKPGINSLREAFATLGVTSDESLRNTAKVSKEAYDAVTASGKASARELTESFRKYATDAIAANNGVATETLKSQAAMRGLEITVDASGKTIVRALSAAADAAKDFGEASKQAGEEAATAAERTLAALEKSNAALERQNAALEKADQLERKRRGIDSQGFAADKSGNRIGAGGELTTRTGILNFLKNAGVSDEATARRITNEFADSQGEIPFFNNPGQLKFGGAGSTISQALLKAAEQFTFAQDAGRIGPPGAPRPAPTPASQTFNVRLDLGGGQVTNVNVNSANDAQALIGALQQAKRQAGG